MLSHPSIRDVAVVAVDDPEWGQRVAAIVVIKEAKVSVGKTSAMEFRLGHSAHGQLFFFFFVDARSRRAQGILQAAHGTLQDPDVDASRGTAPEECYGKGEQKGVGQIV